MIDGIYQRPVKYIIRDVRYYYRYYPNRKKLFIKHQPFHYIIITKRKSEYIVAQDQEKEIGYAYITYDKRFRRMVSIFDFSWTKQDIESFIKYKFLTKPKKSEIARLMLINQDL